MPRGRPGGVNQSLSFDRRSTSAFTFWIVGSIALGVLAVVYLRRHRPSSARGWLRYATGGVLIYAVFAVALGWLVLP